MFGDFIYLSIIIFLQWIQCHAFTLHTVVPGIRKDGLCDFAPRPIRKTFSYQSMNGNNRNTMGGNDYDDNNYNQEDEFIMDPFYEDYELEDNTNDKTNTETNMEDVLKMLIASSSSSSSTAPPSKVQSNSISSPIITEPTSYELSKLISQMESLLLPNTETKHNDDSELDNWDDDNPDAPFLDPDIYANYRNNLNPDGSLAFNSLSGKGSKDYSLQYPGNQGSNKKQGLTSSSMLDSSPDLPKSYFSNSPIASTNGSNNLSADGWSLEDVILQSKPPSTEQVDEDMHTKIMAEEEGFLQQSKRFQEFLSVSGSSSILDPENQDLAYEIRNQRRHDEQAQQYQKLEQEIEKFENSLRENKKQQQQQQQQQQQLGKDDSTTSTDIRIKLVSCSQCGCPLSGVEMDRYRQRSGGMCQICEGEAIAEQSDMRFRNAQVPQVPVSSTTPKGQSPTTKPWNGKEMTQRTNFNSQHQQQQRVEISIPIRSRNQGSHDEERQLLRKQDKIRNSTRIRSELSRNSRLPQQNPQQSQKQQQQQQDQQQRQVMALQQQVEWYKRQWKVAEQRYRAAEEEAGNWRKRVEELEELLLLGSVRDEEVDEDDDVEESWISNEETEADNMYFGKTDAGESTMEYPSSSSQ